VGNVLLLGSNTDHDTHNTDNKRGDTGCKHLLMLVGMAVLDHVYIDVMGNGGGGCQNQAGNNGQDGGKSHGAEESQQQIADKG